MGYMKDGLLADIEDGGSWTPPSPRRGIEDTVEACLALLGDRSEAARRVLTDSLDLTADTADLRRRVNTRCWEIVSLLSSAHTARGRALAAADPAALAPHVAYAGRRIAARLAERGAIPLVVDGQVVARAADSAAADRWLARFEAAL